MNAPHELRLRRSLLIIICFVLFGVSGCAYFKSSNVSYEELEKKNAQTQEDKDLWLQPVK